MYLDSEYEDQSKYRRGITEPHGRIMLSGQQALVRMLLAQAAADRAVGLRTAGFVSGYRGSPLGGLDQELAQAKDLLDREKIRFLSAINEDLAATALIGSQKVESDPKKRFDCVFGMWYGKGPGVDRSGDAIKHGNYYGSSLNGGVLVVTGDDHGCVSSSMSHQSDRTLIAWGLSVVHPSGLADYERCGLWGWALSRASGLWVGFKAITETVEASASFQSTPFPQFAMPAVDPGPDGLHWRWPDLPGMQIERRLPYKLAAAHAFIKANPHATIKIRDVGPNHVTGPNQDWVTANLTAPEHRTEAQRALLSQSDEYIDELRNATHVVIAAPMYNFSVPWNLKAYIDNIVREGETFFFSPETSHGPLLPPNKKLMLIYTAAGDYAPGSEMAQFDFISPYVGGVFYFIGIADYTVVFCGNRGESPVLAEASLKACHERIQALSTVW